MDNQPLDTILDSGWVLHR